MLAEDVEKISTEQNNRLHEEENNSRSSTDSSSQPSKDELAPNMDKEREADSSHLDSNDLEAAVRVPTTRTITDSNHVVRTVTAQDWNGPDDPENPMNWPAWKKVYTTTMVGLIAFVV
jgi:hypothetical protein